MFARSNKGNIEGTCLQCCRAQIQTSSEGKNSGKSVKDKLKVGFAIWDKVNHLKDLLFVMRIENRDYLKRLILLEYNCNVDLLGWQHKE